MIRKPVAALLCVLAFACGKEEAPAELPIATTSTRHEDIPKYTNEPEPEYDENNLLNLAYGAAVVSRTAEATLENSAVQAIDGSSATAWTSPPSSPAQTFVFSLLGPARIARVGITNSAADGSAATTITFEGSSDGVQWRALKTVSSKGAAEKPEFWDVPATTAQYVRISTKGLDTISVRSFHAIGQELGTFAMPPLEGCYRINETPARFVRDGASIRGVIATTPPTLLDGGTDGRVAQFLWTQGPTWGYGAITLAPNAATLTGLRIHEEISTQQYGEGWFGARIPCDGLTLDAPAAGSLKPRTPLERWTMFGLRFDDDDQLIADASKAELDALSRRIAATPSQTFRIVAHELREMTADVSKQRTQKRVDAMRAALKSRGADLSRIEFVSAGDAWSEPPIFTALQRLLASRVDLERVER
ncbi:MAG TPA: discoidin domain-containing protein [Thermoanaerobaculia bacterium]